MEKLEAKGEMRSSSLRSAPAEAAAVNVWLRREVGLPVGTKDGMTTV